MIDPAYLERIGAYFDESDRTYKRHRIRQTGHRYDEDGALVEYDEELVPFPVLMPTATDARSIEEARARAAELNHDFYDPRLGWLRWGRKPERDHAENLGAGSVRHERRRVAVAPPKKGR